MAIQALLNEAYPIIDRIAKIRRKNGAFAYYTGEDIQQEVWAMCLDAIDRYDVSIGPLENYLVKHVDNRLKNLKRDRYFRPGSDVVTSGYAHVRINLVNALPFDHSNINEKDVALVSNTINIDPLEHVIHNETLAYLRSHLTDELLETFDDLVNGNRVRKVLADNVRVEIAHLLAERDVDG